MASLYATSPNASVRQAGKAATGTVGSTLAQPGAEAVAQLGGPDIYINSSSISSTDFYGNQGLVLHEVMHNITGLTDADIQKALGLSQQSDTSNIANKLVSDCL